jgi:hypothetical protein
MAKFFSVVIEPILIEVEEIEGGTDKYYRDVAHEMFADMIREGIEDIVYKTRYRINSA